MAALVLADAAIEKFGGDSVAEARRNLRGYLESLAISLTATASAHGHPPAPAPQGVSGPGPAILIGPPGAGKSTVGAAAGGAARRRASWTPTTGSRRSRASRSARSSSRTARPRSASWSARRWPRRSAATSGVIALGGGAVLDPAPRPLLAGRRSSTWRPGSPPRPSGSAWTGPARCCSGTRARSSGPLLEQRLPVYQRAGLDHRHHRRPDPRAGRRRDRRPDPGRRAARAARWRRMCASRGP